MKRNLIILLALVGALASIGATAGAKERVAKRVADDAVMNPDCKMTEQVTLNTNFSFQDSSPTNAKKRFDQKMREFEKAATDAGLKNLKMQSMNYSISYNGYNMDTSYQLSGNVGYKTEGADGVFAFMEKAKDMNMNISMSVNKYNSGQCN